MTDQRDIDIARVLGWTDIHEDKDAGWVGAPPKQDMSGYYLCRPENDEYDPRTGKTIMHGEPFPYWHIPAYRTNHHAAWRAWAWMDKRGLVHLRNDAMGERECIFIPTATVYPVPDGLRVGKAEATTWEAAICDALLAARPEHTP